MLKTSAAATEIFGLFELNTAGTVFYSKIDRRNSKVNLQTDLIGRNFFEEIVVSENTAELRRRFQSFAKGSDSAVKFTFSYVSEQRPVEVKVMLTQISVREYDEKEKLIILDIRKMN